MKVDTTPLPSDLQETVQELISFFVTCVETPTTLYYGHVQQNADKSFPLMTFEKKPRGDANAVGGRLTGIIPQQVLR